MRVLAVLLPLLLLAAGAEASRTTWRPADAEEVARILLEHVRGAADARLAEEGPFGLRIVVTDGPDASFVYDGTLRPGEAPRPYVVALSTDAALVLRNTPEPLGAFRCLVAEEHVSLASPWAHERFALRALRARADADAACAPPADARQIAPGAYERRGLVFDRYGATMGWRAPDADLRLDRAGAGVSRLGPDALPTAHADLNDPWRAALAIADALAAAADCPCGSPHELIPPGDGRAALAADPRTQEGAR